MDEKRLLERCLQGDGEGFKMMVEMLGAQAMSLAVNILRNHEDAEDACQEAFLQAFQNLSQFDQRQSLKRWFLTILYRRCVDQLRRRKRFYRFFAKLKKEGGLSHAEKNTEFSQAERKILPRATLDSLPPKERAAITLWALEGYTAEEIAEILGCRASTARVYLFKARQKIKALLEKQHV